MNLIDYITAEATMVDGNVATLEVCVWDNWDRGQHYLTFRYDVEFYVDDCGEVRYGDITSDVDVELRLDDDYDTVVASSEGRTDINPLTIADPEVLLRCVSL